MRPSPEQAVLHYLDRLVAHDWEAVSACLHPEVVRIGPFGDVYRPRRPYLEFLSGLMPTLQRYTLSVERTVGRGPVVMVQLTETMEVGGTLDETHEVLVFDTDAAGLITRIDIFIQRAAP